jgi:siroheme synthase
MSLGHVQDIAAQLLQYGMPSETATMCVSWLSYPQQTLVTAPLAQIGAEVAASSLETPALMVVGDVVGFWQHLHHQGGGMEET